MRSYTLKIASYNIRFLGVAEKPALLPSASQSTFITTEPDYDLIINVSTGSATPHNEATRVFSAPYVEEINGTPVKVSDRFWTVYSHGDYILINTTLPLSGSDKEALLTVRPGEKSWDLVIDTESDRVNPFSYPLDGLILYYLSALNGDIFIHGSAVEHGGKGYLFSGMSGRGKSTIARLFSESGAKVIHDDRLIIRKDTGGGYKVYNTPVYEDEVSSETRLTEIFLIEHGAENQLLEEGLTTALAGVMSNCIQHNWNTAHIGILTGALLQLVTDIPVKKLKFVPDSSVIDYLTRYER